MLATITGKVVETLPGTIIIELNGLGYEVRTPTSELTGIVVNETTRLYLHEHIREDSHELYGFASLQSKLLFEQLISVSGVGPKVAIAILSSLDVERVQAAIANGRSDALQAVPGVGKKMAARIIIELKNKLSDDLAGIIIDEKADSTFQALTQLGFSSIQARAVLTKIPEASSEEARLRLALKELGK